MTQDIDLGGGDDDDDNNVVVRGTIDGYDYTIRRFSSPNIVYVTEIPRTIPHHVVHTVLGKHYDSGQLHPGKDTAVYHPAGPDEKPYTIRQYRFMHYPDP